MRRTRSTARLFLLFLLGLLALATLSCGTSTPSRESSSGEPHQDAAVQDSGKRLSGEFNLISQEDSYRRENLSSNATFRFDENGDFKRQDGLRLEEGSYLITAQNELVLYIEKVNGELRSAARVEHYQIADQGDNGITLKEGPSRKLVLLKR